MSMLDRIRDGFKYLDKNGLKKVLGLIKNKDVHWTGTHAEYEAQKDTIPAYAILHFTDDYDDSVGVVDKIENNNMNGVTSNAVYDAIAPLRTVSPMTVTKQGDYINGTNFYGSKVGKVAMIEIDGFTGSSIPWGQTTAVGITTGCASGIVELSCKTDFMEVTTGYDQNGNAIVRAIQAYGRAWIDSYGNIVVFLANPGSVETSYTRNIFIGGTYITA